MALVGEDYEYQRQLGVGGGGLVLLARHRPLDRLVAIKTISTAHADEAARARLRREARALATLAHPSILEVYRLIDGGSSLALICEYLPGGNLDDALTRETLTGSAVVDSLCHLADALLAAHASGIVHRDVKPANVLLDGAGRTVLADFGLARIRGEFRTEHGLSTGTPLYMSPEQILTPEVERPSMDVYSFGILAYRALTGSLPFQASSFVDLIDAHLTRQPERPSGIRNDFPAEVCAVLLGLLEKDPANRANLREVVSVLRTRNAHWWDGALPPARLVMADAPEGALSAQSRTAAAPLGDATQTGPDSADRLQVQRQVETHYLPKLFEPGVYRVSHSRARPRWLIPTLGVLGGLAAGLLIGLIVLFLLR